MGSLFDKKINKDDYFLSINIIGSNLSQIISKFIGNWENLNNEEKQKEHIKYLWEYHYEKNKTQTEQLHNFIVKIKNYVIKSKKHKECLIYKLRKKKEYQDFLTLISLLYDNIRSNDYFPLTIFIIEDEENLESTKSKIQEYFIEKKEENLIKLFNVFFTEKECLDDEYYLKEKNIEKALLRFCSLYNDLGDIFEIGTPGEKNYKKYSLSENLDPFTINILCIGHPGCGKSTTVNFLLNDFKALESSSGKGQTKKVTYYFGSKYPACIVDIPGLDSVEKVNEVSTHIKEANKNINSIKKKFHVVLILFSYVQDRMFSEFEYPVIEEICKIKDAKILYVLTKSKNDIDKNIKNKFAININTSLEPIYEKLKNEIKKEKAEKIIKATTENMIFVNYYDDIKTGFTKNGIDELYKKLCEILKDTAEYKKFQKISNKDEIRKFANEIKEKADSALTGNKVTGFLTGFVPFSNFINKKKAIQTIGEFFGINKKDMENVLNKKKLNEKCKILNEYIKENKKEENNDNGNGEFRGLIYKTCRNYLEEYEKNNKKNNGKPSQGEIELAIGILIVVGVCICVYYIYDSCSEIFSFIRKVLDEYVEFYVDNFDAVKKPYQNAVEYLNTLAEKNSPKKNNKKEFINHI